MNRRLVKLFILLATLACVALATSASAGEKKKKKKPRAEAPRFDVVFVIDATGSMSDEIDAVKEHIWGMAEEMINGKPKPDIRFGVVFYRDVTDTTLFEKTELTRDVQEVQGFLNAGVATGGGDWEEHVGRGLHEALGLEWDDDPDTARLLYLVGDAPPHTDYDDGFSVKTAVSEATQRGIVIHAIGGSGLEQGSSEFEKIAKVTDGTFQFLTYHAVVTDDDGKKKSVVYEAGVAYEADEVLSDSEWRGGAEKLKKKKKLKRASKKAETKAKAAPKSNNLDTTVSGSVKSAAEDMGVAYD